MKFITYLHNYVTTIYIIYAHKAQRLPPPVSTTDSFGNGSIGLWLSHTSVDTLCRYFDVDILCRVVYITPEPRS